LVGGAAFSVWLGGSGTTAAFSTETIALTIRQLCTPRTTTLTARRPIRRANTLRLGLANSPRPLAGICGWLDVVAGVLIAERFAPEWPDHRPRRQAPAVRRSPRASCDCTGARALSAIALSRAEVKRPSLTGSERHRMLPGMLRGAYGRHLRK